MASHKALTTSLLLITLNLLLFTMAQPPSPPPPPPPSPQGNCPIDVLKLGVCADLLGVVNVIIGQSPTRPCCSLIGGLVDLEAAICLCTAIKADVLGNNLNAQVALDLVLNNCGRNSSGYQCN